MVQAVVDEGWPVLGQDASGNSEVRAPGYADICILMRTWTHLPSLERPLEDAGIPYRVESGALLLRTQEVCDLLAGLRAIDDPSDQVALIGALRSPAFACSDPDLLRWVEGGGRLDYEQPGDGPDGPVKSALAVSRNPTRGAISYPRQP
ncbi:MAG: hypothetical protein IT306_20845 [Chloroflexi bacterium]|nr:hypothetical protein [Chloroflexota bacterium]